jgi:hypothetical protein
MNKEIGDEHLERPEYDEDVAASVSEYIKNDCLGFLSNRHLAFCD